MKYIFANWKENLTYPQAQFLAGNLKAAGADGNFTGKTLVLLPPSVFLIPIFEELAGSGILLGVQDISRFEEGAHTGEISAKMVKPYARYFLLGHSERRAELAETTDVINQKLSIGIKGGLIPVICVGSREQLDGLAVPAAQELFIVYEPAEFIGGEKTQELAEIQSFGELVKSQTGAKFIYGGSVNHQNAAPILKEGNVDGVLVGHMSLDGEKFSRLLLLPI